MKMPILPPCPWRPGTCCWPQPSPWPAAPDCPTSAWPRRPWSAATSPPPRATTRPWPRWVTPTPRSASPTCRSPAATARSRPRPKSSTARPRRPRRGPARALASGWRPSPAPATPSTARPSACSARPSNRARTVPWCRSSCSTCNTRSPGRKSTRSSASTSGARATAAGRPGADHPLPHPGHLRPAPGRDRAGLPALAAAHGRVLVRTGHGLPDAGQRGKAEGPARTAARRLQGRPGARRAGRLGGRGARRRRTGQPDPQTAQALLEEIAPSYPRPGSAWPSCSTTIPTRATWKRCSAT